MNPTNTNMADSITPRMDWSSPDVTTALKIFKQQCSLYFAVKDIKPEKQVDHILLFAGAEGLKIFNSWSLSKEDAAKTDTVWEKFITHVEPKTNFRIARFQLQATKQGNESIDSFVSKIRLQALKCKFRDDQEIHERVIEQIILGTRHAELQKTLLEKDNSLSLEAALDICRAFEASIEHMKQLSATVSTTPDATTMHAVQRTTSTTACPWCGCTHKAKPRSSCPAFGTTCGACGKPNHWRVVCKSRKRTAVKWNQDQHKSQPRAGHSTHNTLANEQVNNVRVHDLATGEDTIVVDVDKDNKIDDLTAKYVEMQFNAIDSDKDTRDEVFTDIAAFIKDKNIKASIHMKVDTGAMGNTLPVRIYRALWPEKLDSEGFPIRKYTSSHETMLTAYNGTAIKHFGSITLPCSYENGKPQQTKFFIVDTDGAAILGLQSCRNLKLLTLHCALETKERVNDIQTLIARYPEQFDRVGNFPGEYHIELQPKAHPIIHAARKFAIHLKDALIAELKSMEENGIITKVTTPTDWVNSMVVSMKSNGQLRICLDPKDLNKAIKRCHHKTPTVEEITYKLAGAQYFSKLDAKNGYWSVKLDHESSMLTTFNTPQGRYRYLRMPFGLIMSQDVFQRKMDQILERCDGCIGIADDVIVFGKTEGEHDRNLIQLMETAKEHGLVFNSGKCEIKSDKVKFFGTIYDSKGAHPDPEKVKAISSLPPPNSASQLREFLGFVTYMSPYIPNLADRSAPLRDLLKKDRHFKWSASHQQAFTNIKEQICKEVTLSYFDPNVETTVQVDASLQGIGAALIQNNKPVAFASKSLTDVEQRYANIERELLAVVVGCERFHTYLYGKHFTVESDHKPLEMIALKNLKAAPPRLQRMLLRLQNYDVTIQYKPGSEMLLADGLSRLPSKSANHVELDISISFVLFSTEKLDQIRTMTNNDVALSELKETIVVGWPQSMRGLSPALRKYWSFRDELSIENGLILKGERIIIPPGLQTDILKTLHEGHQGMEKCKLRAKETVFWLNINSDIEKLVQNCQTCQKFQRSQPKEQLMPHEIPSRPWQVLGTDLFYFHGTNYLIIADYYSKFPFIRKMPENCSSQTVINATKEIIAEHGIPEKIISDNGPHYSSEKYKQFTQEWSIKHITSSPHHPQSNGFIERQIQTVKNVLKKALDSRSDVHMGLLCLRSTPIDSKLPSPSTLLFNRQVRTNLPAVIRNRNPERDQIMERLIDRQDQQKGYFDRNTHDLPPLNPGDHVTVQNHVNKQWSPATVKSLAPEPRSYIIESQNGTTLRRNRRDIRASVPNGTPTEVPNDDPPGRDTLCEPPAEHVPEATPQGNSENLSDLHESKSIPYVTRYGRTVKKPT